LSPAAHRASAERIARIGAARSPGGSPSARRRRRLQRIAKAGSDRLFERASIADDTQVASTGDSAFPGRQELARQGEGIANADAELDVQLSREGEMKEGRVGDAACDAAPL
jgi:hypothetical protein